MRVAPKKFVSLIFLITGAATAASFAVRLAGARTHSTAQAAQLSGPSEELRPFAAIEPIDTHVHAFKNDAEFIGLIASLRLHLLDICVADNHSIYGELATELARAQGFVSGSQGHAKLCVTFDPYSFQRKGYGQNVIKQLRQEFADGAIAVKI